jgi:superfamily II DNA or RNA helicase
MSNNQRRFFKNKDARILYIISDGKCAECGRPLDNGWESDHMIPYSKGGPTTIDNGQALCKACNRKKGATMGTTLSEKSFDPNRVKSVKQRMWQTKFAESVLSTFLTGKRDFLCEAVPAGGKTFGSLLIASMMIEQGIVEQVIVVAPTDYLRDQWVRKSWSMGGVSLKPFEIDPRTGRVVMNDDYCGVVTTYAQVASGSNADVLFGMGRRKPTLVIFDEVHHCGEEKTWGSGVQSAFWARGGENLFHRLSISGTPFRSDNERIPFVNYEKKYFTKEDGTMEVHWASISDFRYRYVDALMDDEVVREVTFRMETGKFSWQSNVGEFSGKEFTDVAFDDNLNEMLWNERYRTAVRPINEATGKASDFVTEILVKANEELSAYRDRRLHPHAGGLVLVEDKEAAEFVGELLTSITGEKAVIVHNGITDARTMIEKFSEDSARWIVSIRMVSEGVDIPRLRVAVYLSSYKTQLFFLQFVGRVTRWMNTLPIVDRDGMPLGQPATIFIPSDPELVKYARELQDEINAYIRMKMARLGEGGNSGGTRTDSEYRWLNATDAEDQAEGHHAAGGYAEALPEEFSEIDEFRNRFQILRHATRGNAKGMMEYLRNHNQQAGTPGSETTSERNGQMGHLMAVQIMVERDKKNQEDGWGSTQSKAPAKKNLDLRASVSKMVPRLAATIVKAELTRGRLLNSWQRKLLYEKGIRLEIGENNRLSQDLTAHMIKMIHAALKKYQGVDTRNANNEQITERLRLLADWEDEVASGKTPLIPGLTD